MSLNAPSVRFLCATKALGVDFRSTAMIGRQSMSTDKGTLRKVFTTLGIHEDAGQFLQTHRYAEAFFRHLGADEVASVDCSGYEEATVIHDLNCPLSGELRSRFSVVYDGGSLEHVFNLPQALKNCMQMVEIGGHFIQVSPANNYMGHGFWQISPELLFRIFSPSNGFQLKVLLLQEEASPHAWYRVRDPDQLKTRVKLVNSSPTLLFCMARKTAEVSIFDPPPVQSDYVRRWAPHPEQKKETACPSVRIAPSMNPKIWIVEPLRWMKKSFQHARKCLVQPRKLRGFNPEHYTKISDHALMRGLLE